MENMLENQYVVVVINSGSIETKTILCKNEESAIGCLNRLFERKKSKVVYDIYDTYMISDGTYAVVSYDFDSTEFRVCKLECEKRT